MKRSPSYLEIVRAKLDEEGIRLRRNRGDLPEAFWVLAGSSHGGQHIDFARAWQAGFLVESPELKALRTPPAGINIPDRDVQEAIERASENEIRRKMVEAGVVDVMIAIGSNFFYTVTLPCTLWFLDKGKTKLPPSPRKEERAGPVLSEV